MQIVAMVTVDKLMNKILYQIQLCHLCLACKTVLLLFLVNVRQARVFFLVIRGFHFPTFSVMPLCSVSLLLLDHEI